MKFDFILVEKAEFSVSGLCRVLGVSRQGFYAHVKRAQSARAEGDRELRVAVKRVFEASRGTYGSPRVHAALRAEGYRIGKARVERAMRELGLQARRRRRYRATTVANAAHPVASNTLNREFTADAPNQRWVTDITYVRTAVGWCYLAAILDLHSRSVVGWALGPDLSTELPLRALRSAVVRRRPKPGLLHHSDRGCQYTSALYRKELATLGIQASMSRKGNCWDNAVAESFFATIKCELVHRHRWTSQRQLQAALFDYIETFYNRERLHSTLGYQTPAQVDAKHQFQCAV